MVATSNTVEMMSLQSEGGIINSSSALDAKNHVQFSFSEPFHSHGEANPLSVICQLAS